MKLMIAILYIRSPRILLIFLKLHNRVLLFFILLLADAPLKLGIYLVTQIEVCIVCTERLVCTWYVLSKIFISTFIKKIRIFIYFFKFIKYFDLQDRKKGKKKSPRMNAWSVRLNSAASPSRPSARPAAHVARPRGPASAHVARPRPAAFIRSPGQLTVSKAHEQAAEVSLSKTSLPFKPDILGSPPDILGNRRAIRIANSVAW